MGATARTRTHAFDPDPSYSDSTNIIPADLAAELGLPAGTPLGMLDDGDDPPVGVHVSGGGPAGSPLASAGIGAASTPRQPEPEPSRPPPPIHEDEPDPDDDEDDDEEENEPPKQAAPYASPNDRPSTGLLASYESRIQILDAWQYWGQLKGAPAWVDRNWVAWGDHDPVREIDPGPALRVPVSSGDNVMCRIGDYVCRQSVTLHPDAPPDIRVEVWDRNQFEKLFIPAPSRQGRYPQPAADHRGHCRQSRTRRPGEGH